MRFNMDGGVAFENEEEMKNVEDPVIREMLNDWKIGNSFQEDERAQTVHGKRSNRPKIEAIPFVQEPSFNESPIAMQRGLTYSKGNSTIIEQ